MNRGSVFGEYAIVPRFLLWFLVAFVIVFLIAIWLIWLFPCALCEEKRRRRKK